VTPARRWPDVDFGALVSSFAKFGLPLLGAALPIPGGLAIGTALANAIGSPSGKPEDILQALSANPAALQAAREFQAKHEERLLELTTQAEIEARKADSADIAQVNQTMREESKSEHWLQWSWRPLNGLTLALGSLLLVVGVLIMAGMAVYQKDFATLNAIPTIVMAVTSALAVPGAVCGVTAWHRGVKQRIEAGEVRAVGGAVNGGANP